MARLLEELVQDHLHQWLTGRQDIDRVSTEVTIPGGRIDLLARDQDGNILGFEVKYHGKTEEKHGINNTTKLFEQLARYRSSGRLDELYFCAPATEPFVDQLESSHSEVDTSQLSQVSKDLRAAYADGQLTKKEIEEGLERHLPDSILQGPSGYQSDHLNTVKKLMLNRLGDDPFEANSRNPDIAVEKAADLIESSFFEFPAGVGVIKTGEPLRYPRGARNEQTRFRTVDNFAELLHPDTAPEPEIVQESDTFERESTPDLPVENEGTLHFWFWKHFEDYDSDRHAIREAPIPHPELGSCRIDVLVFEGALSAREIRQNQESDSYGLYGIEVKGKGIPSTDSRIEEQLENYISTGCLTGLYFAVPESDASEALDVLESSSSKEVRKKVGLLGISRDREVRVAKEPEPLKMRYDGRVRHSDIRDRTYYTEIGFESLAVQEKSKFERSVPSE